MSLGREGKNRGQNHFIEFDLLSNTENDLRYDQLLDRRAALTRFVTHVPRREPIIYADHVQDHGESLFQRVCAMDLESIVAKLASGPYVSDREQSTWRKILNPNYSQRVGRQASFERDRNGEPVPDWHTCELACAASAGNDFAFYVPVVRLVT